MKTTGSTKIPACRDLNYTLLASYFVKAITINSA